MNGECLLVENNCATFDFATYYDSQKATWKGDLDTFLGVLTDGKVDTALSGSNIASPSDLKYNDQYFLVYLAYDLLKNDEGFDNAALATLMYAQDENISKIISNETKTLATKGSEIFTLISSNLKYSSTDLTSKIIEKMF